MTDFATGCTHFGDANITGLATRPCDGVVAMDSVLIRNWSVVVQPHHAAHPLVDFAFRQIGAGRETDLSKLHGPVALMQRSHDPKGRGVDDLTAKANKVPAVRFHYQIEEWEGWDRGATPLHCQPHKPDVRSAERRGNVGVDATHFAPIRLGAAIERLQEQER